MTKGRSQSVYEMMPCVMAFGFEGSHDIEVKTGMTHSRGSVLRRANDELLRAGVIVKPIRTKAKCLAIYSGWLEGVAEELVKT